MCGRLREAVVMKGLKCCCFRRGEEREYDVKIALLVRDAVTVKCARARVPMLLNRLNCRRNYVLFECAARTVERISRRLRKCIKSPYAKRKDCNLLQSRKFSSNLDGHLVLSRYLC